LNGWHLPASRESVEVLFLFRRLKLLIPVACLMLMAALNMPGCGKSGASAVVRSSAPPGASEPGSSSSGDLDKSITNASTRTAEEKNAARAALRYAEDANTGSRFKAHAIKVCKGWARVAVEQADVPPDEAVSFGVFLRRDDDGRWEVAETGTGVTSDDLPGAPAEIFKPE
jgi:hypothetical protein